MKIHLISWISCAVISALVLHNIAKDFSNLPTLRSIIKPLARIDIRPFGSENLPKKIPGSYIVLAEEAYA